MEKNVFPTELTPGRGPKLSLLSGPVPPGHHLGVAKKTLVHLDRQRFQALVEQPVFCRQCQPELGTPVGALIGSRSSK